MKILLLVSFIILSSCTQKTEINPPANKGTTTVITCSGNPLDGSLPITNLDTGVIPLGATSFVLNGNNKCVIQSCEQNYQVTNSGLACEPVSCSLANSGIIHALSVGGDLINGCTVSSCENNYETLDNITCSPVGCTLANSNLSNALTVTGDLISGCQVSSCQNNYQQIGNSCQVISCNLGNAGINNVLSVSGDLVSGCNVVSCETNYEKIGNTCQPIACTTANAGINNALSVSGNLVSGCQVSICQNNYEKVGNTCSAVACTVVNSGINNASSVTGNLVSGCNVLTCEPNYDKVGNLCEAISCTISNSNISKALTVSGDLVSGCTVNSCESNYEVLNNECSPINCTPLNSGITNVSSVTGTFVSGCQVASCETNYEQIGNTCQAINCTPANSNISHVLTVSGDLVSGCLVTTCETNYEKNGNSCDAIACTVSNSGITNAMSVSGDLIGGCQVESCETNYEKIGNSCQEIACTPENSGINNVLSVSGDLVSGCNVVSCQSNYEQVGNTCSAIACTPANSGISHANQVYGDLVNGCNVISCDYPYDVNNNSCSPISCTPSNSGINFSTLVIGDLVSGCSLISCEVNYTVNGNICEETQCTVANSGINFATQVSGNLVSGCNVLTCESNYEVAGNQCSPVACTVLNSGIANVNQVYGDLVSGCNVLSCEIEYQEDNNQCIGEVCSLGNAVGNGVSSISNVLTVSGTIHDNSCVVSSCDVFYKESGDLTFCEEKICSELNGSELTTIGYNISNGTLSGSYPSCSLSCNLSSQQLAVDGLSCEDKTPTLSIDYIKDYTQSLSNEVSVTYLNAQSIDFYHDAGCTNSILNSSLSSSPAVFSITSVGSEGTQTIYAKAHNGTKDSGCQSASIVYDISNPTVSISEPSPSVIILSNIITVTGTCFDSISGVESLELNVGGVISQLDCIGGVFSGDADVSDIGDGNIDIVVKALDNAVNEQTATVEVIKQSSGLIDGTFNGLINISIRQTDGKLLVGGSFTSFTTTGGTVYTTNRIARLNTNGTIDTSFATNIGTIPSSGFNSAVNAMALDSQKNIYVGGNFTSFKGIANNANRFAKLKPTGEFDQTFSDNLDVSPGIKAPTSGFNENVLALAIDSQDNIYVGGLIKTFKGQTNNSNGIAKFNSSGIFNQAFSDSLDVVPGVKGIDSGLNRSSGAFVSSIVVDSQDNFYVGGTFENFKDIANNANKIAKFNSSGVFDQSFSDNLDVSPGIKATTSGFRTGATVTVNGIAIDSSSNLYVVGRFANFKSGTNNAKMIAKLNSAGVFDNAFSDNLDVSPGIKAPTSGFSAASGNPQLWSIIIDKNNDLLVGGNIDSFRGTSNNARGIAKISKLGVFNQSFSDNLDVSAGIKLPTSGFYGGTKVVANITIDSSNNIYVAGDYTNFIGNPELYYIKLLNSGLEP